MYQVLKDYKNIINSMYWVVYENLNIIQFQIEYTLFV